MMKSPFINEFGSSGVKTGLKDLTILKNIHPFSKNIGEALKYESLSDFDGWIEAGLKKKNKYVLIFYLFIYLVIYKQFIDCLFAFFLFFRKKLYSDKDNLISPGFVLGVETIVSRQWFYTLDSSRNMLSSSVSFYFLEVFNLKN